MALRLDAHADLSRIGSWGILFFCCGTMAGQSPSWKATIVENIPSPSIALVDFLRGRPEREMYGLEFAEYIKKWSQDESAKSLARQRLAALPSTVSEKLNEALMAYFPLAIQLNSYTKPYNDELARIWAWAEASGAGWQTLFFAAGLLLSGDETVRWEKMASALLAPAGAAKPELKALFERYSRLR